MSSHEITGSKKNKKELRWWSAEKMDMELGPKKALGWRESGLLPTRPDRITGGSEAHELEYMCPEDYELLSDGEKWTMGFNTSTDADEKDVKALGSGSAQPMAIEDTKKEIIKAEPETEEEILKKRTKQLVDTPRPVLLQFQEIQTDVRVWVARAGGVKYAEIMATEATKFLNKCGPFLTLSL